MSLVAAASILFIFAVLILIFAFSKKSYAIGGWVTIIILITLVLCFINQGNPSQPERVHPAYLIGKYN